MVFFGCKKDDGVSPTSSKIDPALIGAWYAPAYSVGFEISGDGSARTLVVELITGYFKAKRIKKKYTTI